MRAAGAGQRSAAPRVWVPENDKRPPFVTVDDHKCWDDRLQLLQRVEIAVEIRGDSVGQRDSHLYF